MRYRIRLAYKGTNYHGWQKQHNALGVQSVLDEKLSLLLYQSIETLGCGRTDTGVHAQMYYAHFDSENTIDCNKLIFKLNQTLPSDIAIQEIVPTHNNFNARFDAEWREYEYWIITEPNPFLHDFAWYQYGYLDIGSMNNAAKILLGKNDFECFSKVHTQVNNFICDVMLARWQHKNDKLVFTIRANRFLRNMVRAIVGTLLQVGRGKLNENDVRKILDSKNRCEAGQSVPAKGLHLTDVFYSNN